MAQAKTQEEINLQIEGLLKMKGRLPQVSGIGTRNWEEIDAQIAVLKGEKTPDDYWEDETAEEFTDGDNDVYHAADRAKQWKLGLETEDLFEE
jgi:hypothetical protein